MGGMTSQTSSHISAVVQDRDTVTVKDYQEVTQSLLNGAILCHSSKTAKITLVGLRLER